MSCYGLLVVNSRNYWVFLTKISLIIGFSFLFGLSSEVFYAPASAETLQPRVLILNSYHKGYQWTDDLVDGITSTLKERVPDVEVWTDYLNLKHFSSDLHSKLELDKLRGEYKRLSFDAVIISDDPGFNLVLEHRTELFKDTPIIFVGLNNFDVSRLDGFPRITGVSESIDFTKTLDVTLALHPKTKRVIILSRSSITGKINVNQMGKVQEKYIDRAKFEYWTDLTISEVATRLREIPKNEAIIFPVDVLNDEQGNQLGPQALISRLHAASLNPIYTAWDFWLGFGIVGGNLQSGKRHGSLAAEMAIRIINGTPVSDIPVALESPNPYMFDYRALKEFDISEQDLPEGSIITHEPPSIFNDHALMVWLTLLFMTILLVVIAFLVTALRKRKQAEDSLRKSEARLSLHINNTPMGVVAWDADFNCTQWNPAAEKIFGFTKKEALANNVRKMIPEEVQGQDEDVFQALLHQSGGNYNVNKNLTKDAQVIVCEWFNTLLVNENGETIGVASMVQDITERMAMEKDLSNALVDAERANQAKSEFLASMSHELRTPLNAILGFAQLMQYDPGNPISTTQNEHIESILSGGNHLLALVNEVLDLARIEADQVSVFVEKVNVEEIVEVCVGLSAPLGEQRGIKIIDRCCKGASFILQTDRLRFKQALINLLSNAIKFNKDGGTVTVEGRTTDPGFLRISVTDTGVGIAKKGYEGVFQLFHRLDSDPMVSREGTGIGLTVTKLLVERMAGRIGFDSQEGVGSTFWIELPLASNDNVLIWTEDMKIGIDAIDKDHQKLISKMNKITHKTSDDAGVDDVIRDFIDYAHDHFKREEVIMRTCAYPELEKHCNLHQILMEQVNDKVKTWRKDHDPECLAQFGGFLKDWLLGHILEEDAKIAFYTKDKKLEIRKALETLV